MKHFDRFDFLRERERERQRERERERELKGFIIPNSPLDFAMHFNHDGMQRTRG